MNATRLSERGQDGQLDRVDLADPIVHTPPAVAWLIWK